MTATIITELLVKPERWEEVVNYMREMLADVHDNEPGIVFYQSYTLPDRPNELWVVEVFADEATKEAHLRRADYRVPFFDEVLAKPALMNTAIPLERP